MDIEGHLAEEEIERYSLAASAEPELSRIEEHLLLCSSCRKKVEASDSYVNSMRHAATRIRSEEKRAPRWAGMAFLLAAAVILAGVLLIRGNAPVPFAVSLAATRGRGNQRTRAGRHSFSPATGRLRAPAVSLVPRGNGGSQRKTRVGRNVPRRPR